MKMWIFDFINVGGASGLIIARRLHEQTLMVCISVSDIYCNVVRSLYDSLLSDLLLLSDLNKERRQIFHKNVQPTILLELQFLFWKKLFLVEECGGKSFLFFWQSLSMSKY